MSNVNPQINIGYVNGGSTVDNLQISFNKFNQHTHSKVLAQNLLHHNISIGDVVTVVGAEFADPFLSILNPTPLTVVNITTTYIQLSRTSSNSTGCKLYVKGKVTEYLYVASGSNQLILDSDKLSSSDYGSVTSKYLETLSTECLTGNWPISVREFPNENPYFYNTTTLSPGWAPIDERDTVTIDSFNIIDPVLPNLTSNTDLYVDVVNGAFSIRGIEGFNPNLNLVKGNTYTFYVSSNVAMTGGLHIVSEIVSSTLPFSSAYSKGIEFFYSQGSVTGFIFRIPLDSPDKLYYQAGAAGYRYGTINLIPSPRYQDLENYSLFQSNLDGALPTIEPVISIPVLINAQVGYRLDSVYVFPFWDSGFTAGQLTCQLTKQDSVGFKLLTDRVQVTSFGKTQLDSISPLVINPNDAIFLSVYSHNQLLNLSYQVNLLKILT